MVGTLQRCLCMSLVVCLPFWGFSLLPQYTLSYEASLSQFLKGCRVGGRSLECIDQDTNTPQQQIRRLPLTDRSALIAETLRIARLSNGSETVIQRHEIDLQNAINSSDNAAHANAHIKNFLSGVKAQPSPDQKFLVVDSLTDVTDKIGATNNLPSIGNHDLSPFSQELPASYYFAHESRSLLPWKLPKWNPYIGSGFPQLLDGHNPYYSPIHFVSKLWPGDASRDFLIFFRIWYWVFGILLIVSQYSHKNIVLFATGTLAVLAPYHTNYIDISFLDVDLLAPLFPALIVLFQSNRLSFKSTAVLTLLLGALAGSFSFIQAQVVFCLSVLFYAICFVYPTKGKSLLLAAITGLGFLFLWPSWSPIVLSLGEFISARDFFSWSPDRPCYATIGLTFETLTQNIFSIPTVSTAGRYTFLTLPGIFLILSVTNQKLTWMFFASLIVFGGIVIWGAPASLCSIDWANGVAFARHSVSHATVAFLVLIGISLGNAVNHQTKKYILFFWLFCLILSYVVSNSSLPKPLFWSFSVLGTLLLFVKFYLPKNMRVYRDVLVVSSLVLAIAPTFWFSNKYLFLRIHESLPRQARPLLQQLDPVSPIGLIQHYSRLEDRRHHSPDQILDGNWSGVFGILDLKINMPLYTNAYWELNSKLFRNWSGKGLIMYPSHFFGPNSLEDYFSKDFEKLMVIHRISLISFETSEVRLNPSVESLYSKENCRLLGKNSAYSSYICPKVGGVGFYPKKVVQVSDQKAVLDFLKSASVSEANGLAVISSDQLPHAKAAKGKILSVYRNGDDLAYDLQVEEAGIFVVADTYTKHWKAWVNEKPAKIRVVNYAFKGVEISRGRVHLRFEYR